MDKKYCLFHKHRTTKQTLGKIRLNCMMDVDNDIDSSLLVQFSSMGTTDKEVLISEFQKLLGNQLNPEGCAFFLDMNNW